MCIHTLTCECTFLIFYKNNIRNAQKTYIKFVDFYYKQCYTKTEMKSISYEIPYDSYFSGTNSLVRHMLIK